ncbi:uncharacterized protein LOC112529870 [Cynara cardunculus var. scolymus]|uniref:uncharacterized protein LOC112529870 n=1 Tax=Cynara cardunculus var. scolymus TaxID=59895 RepID=UPI000D6250E0|nr:uncharacterized protein LOC112529870 [Cynara cardunculus var. scolymus]
MAIDTKPPLPFPSDFPYEFASSSSNESESDDDDISGLTRRFTRSFSLQERLKIPYPLQKKRVFSGSPEATLSWAVSGPTHVRSSPTTPFVHAEEDAWDLIYAAAGQVARMKMRMNNVNDDVFANRGLLVSPRPLAVGPPFSHHHPNCTIWRSGSQEFIKQQHFRYRVTGAANYGGGGRCGGGQPMGFRQSAWPPLPVENHRRQQPSTGFIAKPVLGGSGGGCGRETTVLKRECAGTGVFLPRRYSNDPPESKKKPACSPAHMPARVAQSLNKSMEPIIPQIHLNTHGRGYTQSDNGSAMVGRRSGGGESAEVVLPQEWTY